MTKETKRRGEKPAAKRKCREPEPPATPRPPGRPSRYTPERAAEICALIAEGYSLRQIEAIDGQPDRRTILRWLDLHEEFRPQYARAREAQAEHFADEILEIADDGTNDWVTRQNADGSDYEAVDHEHIQRSRLRVDARKWLMSKMAPKKYGDRIAQEHSGPDGGPIPISHGIDAPARPETPEEWLARRQRELSAVVAATGPATARD